MYRLTVLLFAFLLPLCSLAKNSPTPGCPPIGIPSLVLRDTIPVKANSCWWLIEKTTNTRVCEQSQNHKSVNTREDIDTLGALAVEAGISDSLVLLAVSNPGKSITVEEKEISTNTDLGFLIKEHSLKTKTIRFSPTEKKVYFKPSLESFVSSNLDGEVLVIVLLVLLFSFIAFKATTGKIKAGKFHDFLWLAALISASFYTIMIFISINAFVSLLSSPLALGATTAIMVLSAVLASFSFKKDGDLFLMAVVSALLGTVLIGTLTKNFSAEITYLCLSAGFFLLCCLIRTIGLGFKWLLGIKSKV
jgi:hypothetical protein